MARYFLNIGANWGDTANWSDTSGGSGGFSVPTSADDVYFDANSGNCDVNASARAALTLTFTGYTNTITMSNNIAVSGNVTLDTTMTIAGAGGLFINATSTINTDGKYWPNTITFNGIAITVTLASDLDTLNLTIAQAVNINGAFAVNISGNLTINNTTVSTTPFNLIGTGVWSGTGALNTTLNINPSGTLTVSGVVTFILNTLNYIAGTVITTGSRLATGGNGATTFNTAGITWDSFSIEGSSTATLTSVLTCNNFEHRGAGNCIINGSNLEIYGNITLTVSNSRTLSGTSLFLYLGTGVWSSTNNSPIMNNLTINTAGTLTISGTVAYQTGTLTYITGTVITTGSTLKINASTTLNTNGINWNNFSSIGTITVTLTSDLHIYGNAVLAGTTGANITTINGADMYCYANCGNQNGTISGTTKIILAGTGVVNVYAGGFNNIAIDINTAGTITFISGFNISNCIFTYISGTVIHSGNISISPGCQLDLNVSVWDTIRFSSAGTTITLLSDLNCNSLNTSGFNNLSLNGFTCYTNSFVHTGNDLSGTSNLVFSGTGTWSGTGYLRLNTTINTAGTLTISGTVAYSTGTLTYTAGTVDTTGSTLSITASCTLNTSGITWNNIGITGTGTYTLNSTLSISNQLTLPNAAVTFAGTAGFTCHTFSGTTALTGTRAITFQQGITYLVTNSLVLTGSTSSFNYTFTSSSGAVDTFFNLQAGATQSVLHTNAIRINSAGGQTIYTTAGRTLTNTTNWNYRTGGFLIFF